ERLVVERDRQRHESGEHDDEAESEQPTARDGGEAFLDHPLPRQPDADRRSPDRQREEEVEDVDGHDRRAHGPADRDADTSGTALTSSASISSLMRIAPSCAVNPQPTVADSARPATSGAISRVLKNAEMNPLIGPRPSWSSAA